MGPYIGLIPFCVPKIYRNKRMAYLKEKNPKCKPSEGASMSRNGKTVFSSEEDQERIFVFPFLFHVKRKK